MVAAGVTQDVIEFLIEVEIEVVLGVEIEVVLGVVIEVVLGVEIEVLLFAVDREEEQNVQVSISIMI